MAKQDYYELLGVAKNADAAALKSAYRKLAVKYHPDKNPGDAAAEAKFKEISEAYDILSDPQKKAAYDRFGHGAFDGTGGPAGGGFGGGEGFGGFSDIFEDFFGGAQGRGGGGRQRQSRGSDKQVRVNISLEDAFTGKRMDLQVPLRRECGSCHGSGAGDGSAPEVCAACGGSGQANMQRGFFAIRQTCGHCQGRGVRITNPCGDCRGGGWQEQRVKVSVTVPAGIEDGQRLRMSGKGNSDAVGAPAGDLYIIFSVAPHEWFERQGEDIVGVLPIGMVSAALGDEVEVPTIDGGKARVKIKEGMQHGDILRLRGKGMPVLNSGGRRGDMYLKVEVEVPVNLSDGQKKLLREFADGGGADQHPNAKGFFDKVKDLF